MPNYRLKIRTLSPLFIGSGTELRQGFDFSSSEKQTGRFNVEKILDARFDTKKPMQRPDQMLSQADYSNPAFFRYVLPGSVRTQKADGRLQECIKDVYDCPYIPGSSIKGAIRTALSVQMLKKNPLNLQNMIDCKKSPKQADDSIETSLFVSSRNTERGKIFLPRPDEGAADIGCPAARRAAQSWRLPFGAQLDAYHQKVAGRSNRTG